MRKPLNYRKIRAKAGRQRDMAALADAYLIAEGNADRATFQAGDIVIDIRRIKPRAVGRFDFLKSLQEIHGRTEE